MENAERSKRTREAAIQAALTIIERDGPSRLTIDAIAKESGISKGGVLHQFRTKDAVLRALMEHQIANSRAFYEACLQQVPADAPERSLRAQIETFRKAAKAPRSTTFAIAGTLGEVPDLLDALRKTERQRVAVIMKETDTPDDALIRWAAAQGLALSAILGMSPWSDKERERLFDLLLPKAAAPVRKKSRQ